MGALPVLEMVLVGGEWRALGIVSPEELEELERMHDAGDLRAEARLELLREGRVERTEVVTRQASPPPSGTWSNVFPPPSILVRLAMLDGIAPEHRGPAWEEARLKLLRDLPGPR